MRRSPPRCGRPPRARARDCCGTPASAGTASTARSQQRQRCVEPAALVEDDAQEMLSPSDGRARARALRGSRARRRRGRRADAPRGALRTSASGVGRCGDRAGAPRAERAVAMLVALAAAARTRIVAARDRRLRGAVLDLREQRPRFRVIGRRREDALRDRARGVPLAQRDAVAQELHAVAASARSRRKTTARAPRSRPAERCGRS